LIGGLVRFVPILVTFRLLAIATLPNWDTSNVDIDLAFLHGEIDTEVYIGLPEGFRSPDKCGKLLKSIYGLRQAPRVGRKATHEIGHWLDCFHIWGDDGTPCSGTDHCDDMPNQAGLNRGTPTFPHISCNNGPKGDLF
jgi:hypothetical protein